MNLLEKTKNHLTQVTGEPPLLSEVADRSLPLHLRQRYRLFRASLFGREWILAMESERWATGAPGEYRQHAHQIARAAGGNVVLVLCRVSAVVRNRMVQMGIPFIVPETQIFLPVCMISLQETFGGVLPEKDKPLTPAAQVLMLYQILHGGLETMSSKQIAEKLGYSEMATSKARAELTVNRLCETFRDGKEIRIRCGVSSHALWEQVRPLLRTPVSKRHWISWQAPVPGAKLAGISALARMGNLADDPIPTYALPKKHFRTLMEQGAIHGCADPEEADARLEAWQYIPELLSDGPMVDPLSLYLSLRDNPDERVQAELSALLEDMPWR